jgi:arylsulfatase
MKKNIVIAGLACSNPILLAALIYVCVKWSAPRPPLVQAGPVSSIPRPDADTGAQEFTFKAPGHVAENDMPLVLNRALTITATFDTQEKDGVIIAQGGVVQGYALYVQDGELWFALRRLKVLTTVSGGKVSAGRQTVTATLSKAGELALARNGIAPATAQAAGTLTVQPVDGLDIGADRGAPVGPYKIPNAFEGTIETINLKTAP